MELWMFDNTLVYFLVVVVIFFLFGPGGLLRRK